MRKIWYSFYNFILRLWRKVFCKDTVYYDDRYSHYDGDHVNYDNDSDPPD